jgi:6-phosphogluconolactonase (cycloisomerase 2 family)
MFVMVRRVCCSGLLGCLLAACFSLALASTALSAPFAYVANVEGGSISQYALSRVGLLGSLMPPTVPAGDRPSAIAFSPDGRSVYVTDLAGEIRQFDVAAGGQLIPKLPATVPAGANPIDLLVSPDGRSVYASNRGEEYEHQPSLSQYDVGPHGELTPKQPASIRTAGGALRIAGSPDGRSVYLSYSEAYGIERFGVGADGRLTPAGNAEDVSGSFDIAVSPDGRNLYAAGKGIARFRIGSGGELAPKGPPTIDGDRLFVRIVVSPDGRSVYASIVSTISYGGDKIAQYDVAGNGRLIPKDPPMIANGTEPDGLAVTPDGRRLYVTNRDADTISQYRIRSDGTLRRRALATVAAGDEPWVVAVNPRPTTRAACKQGGWRRFGFRSQKRCMRWVARHRSGSRR